MNIFKLFFCLTFLFSINANELNDFAKDLDFHISFINEIYKTKSYLKTHNLKMNYMQNLLESTFEFKEKNICNCIEKMKKINDINPMFDLWKDFNQVKLNNNLIFIREMATLVLIIYKNLLIKILPNFFPNIPADEIISIYQQALGLPIDKIFIAVNQLYNKILQIVIALDLDNKPTWPEWLKQYWYIPTSIGTAIITIVLNNYFTD